MCILSSVNTEGVCLQWPSEWSTEYIKAPFVAVTTIISEYGSEYGIQIIQLIIIYSFFVDVIFFYCVKMLAAHY